MLAEVAARAVAVAVPMAWAAACACAVASAPPCTCSQPGHHYARMPSAQPCRDGMCVLCFHDRCFLFGTEAIAGFGALNPSCRIALVQIFGQQPKV